MARLENLSGVSVLRHDKFIDHRGELYTLWKDNELPSVNFNHDKISKSFFKVLRGLHTDKSWKLISCLHGTIQLVIVNFDKTSAEYLCWTDYILNSEDIENVSILVPPGYLNGHLVLSEEALFYYKWSYQGEYPDVKDQISANWSDKKININWMIDDPILSDRDKGTPML
jgi:dTDP-4-dehydrorhamnose 3,5-epimerase